MSVVCQCPSCKAKYQVGDQYAGNTIKCPKCSAAVVVPAGAQPPVHRLRLPLTSSLGRRKRRRLLPLPPKSNSPKPEWRRRVEDSASQASPPPVKAVKAIAISPAEALRKAETPSMPPTADDGLGFLAEERAGSKRRAGPAMRSGRRPSDQPVATMRRRSGVAFPTSPGRPRAILPIVPRRKRRACRRG